MGSLASRGSADSYAVALYSGLTQNRAYVDASLGYIYGADQLTRTESLAGAPRNVVGKPQSHTAFGAVETGFHMPFGMGFDAIPFARIDAASYRQRSFTETGGGDFGLAVQSQTTLSVASTLGGKLSARVDAPWGAPLIGTLKAGWVHEYADVDRPVTAAFAGAALIPFTVQAARIDRDAALVGAKFETREGAVSLFTQYEGRYGPHGNASAVTAGLAVFW